MKLQQHLRATLIVTGLGLLAGACAKKQAEAGHQEEAPQPVVLTTPSVMSVPTTSGLRLPNAIPASHRDPRLE